MKQHSSIRKSPAGHARGSHARQLRIISGRWRGRRWQFPIADIRPTPDRVRETLFNWLQDRISGRVLDLFAGSGALGLEALSRGATAATFVEQRSDVAQALRTLLREWGAGAADVRCMEAQRFLSQPPQKFDLVFLDPPYAENLLAAAAEQLSRGWLAPHALIYVEHSKRAPLPPLPQQWRSLKSGQAGEVGYHLFEHDPGDPS